MKLTSIALASALAMTGTVALAQSGGGSADGSSAAGGVATGRYMNDRAPDGVTGSAREGRDMNRGTVGANGSPSAGGPNGSPGGPTSLSGTGSSQFGGSLPGGANGR
jgi:hypothetical protein